MSTIHSDKASSIPMRLYSLLESSQDINQFVASMHRYIQLGIHIKGFFSKKYNRFQREITQVVEFYVDDEDNEAKVNVLYSRDLMDNEVYNNPTQHLIDYLASQGVMMPEDPFIPKGSELKSSEEKTTSENTETTNIDLNNKPAQTNNVKETKTTATASNIVPEVPVQPGITPVNKTQEISNINQNVNPVNTGVNNVNNNSNLEIVEI